MMRNLEDMTTVDDGASSSIVPGSTHEVFLSFRGVDTRLNFTDHLYNYLIDVGVQTFRDNEELRVGKQIRPDLMKAIEESCISIPIFSKDYASSKWCLMELNHMVKCMNHKHPEGRQRHTVCPIFYDVTPSDVRHQTGRFAEAFVKHTNDKEVDACTVQEWKDALKEVCELKGWEKDKIANGHEAELIKEIVKEVCKMLKKNNLSLTDDLVGMDHHREKLTKLLDNGGNGVRIVGIVGMGGIGKTTIAKFMYNKLCDQFQPQCGFLEDVRERVKHNRCAELRKLLISEVLKRSVDGIALDIRNTFRRKKVLIVLDDVEDKSQLKEIIGGRDCFGSGSRIIVTTRNKEVFEEWDGDLIYAPEEMKFKDSLLLFCKHAFRSTQPWEGYEEISREIVQTAAGLPLSLVVIGSMLFRKNRNQWEATLNELRTIPAHKVQERLKISYDTLKDNQQQMFLDIACHFIGEDKTNAIHMWKDCGLNPESCEGIDVLVSRSLITIKKLRGQYRDSDVDIFRMHDHLRDLGRDIVKKEYRSHPGQRSRLWSIEEVREVLDNKSGTEKVETFYYGWVSARIISNEHFKGLSSLRYLHLHGPIILKGDFKGLVSNLRWFRWTFNDEMRVTNFCPRKLVVLDLSRSGIRDGWESAIQIKAATNLKVLNLYKCRHLTKLPECLWNMKPLVELDLSFTGILKLPEQGIGNLTNLTKLLLSGSMIKRLPDAIGKLEKLEVLDCYCDSLEVAIPKGIERLSSLRVLDLVNPLMKVTLTRVRIPLTVASLNGVRGLVNLRDLEFYKNVGYCCESVAEEVVGVVMPSSLKELTLRGLDDHVMSCRLIQAMKFDSSSRLKKLWIDNCTFGMFPIGSLDLSKCQVLKELTIQYCNEMREIKGLEVLTSLEKLTVRDCPLLMLLDLFNWQMLKELVICPAMRDIKSLGVLTSLEELSISKCPLLMLLDLSNCQMLKDLSISDCPAMREIKGLEVLTSLEKLFVRGYPLLKQLDLSNYHMLKEFSIANCPEMREIKGLEVLTFLEKLMVINCALLKLPDLSNCQMLYDLWISDCLEMREIKGLEVLTSLTILSVFRCPLLKKDELLRDLSNLKSLKHIFWDAMEKCFPGE